MHVQRSSHVIVTCLLSIGSAAACATEESPEEASDAPEQAGPAAVPEESEQDRSAAPETLAECQARGACGDEAGRAGAPAELDVGTLAVGLPIHGADTYWGYPHGGYLLRVDQRVRIDDEAPFMYWAHHAWLTGPGRMMYMGLQTNGVLDNGTRGKMAIFSLWGGNGANTGSAGSWCLNFSGEGTGKSCRIRYSFVRGREYTFSLQHNGDDSFGAWWRAQIIDRATGAVTTIGRIRAPTGSGLISSTASFSEVFGGTYPACRDITFSQAVFWPPVSWALFQPGTYAGSNTGNLTNACANGKAIQYGTVKVHQMGW